MVLEYSERIFDEFIKQWMFLMHTNQAQKHEKRCLSNLIMFQTPGTGKIRLCWVCLLLSERPKIVYYAQLPPCLALFYDQSETPPRAALWSY